MNLRRWLALIASITVALGVGLTVGYLLGYDDTAVRIKVVDGVLESTDARQTCIRPEGGDARCAQLRSAPGRSLPNVGECVSAIYTANFPGGGDEIPFAEFVRFEFGRKI